MSFIKNSKFWIDNDIKTNQQNIIIMSTFKQLSNTVFGNAIIRIQSVTAASPTLAQDVNLYSCKSFFLPYSDTQKILVINFTAPSTNGGLTTIKFTSAIGATQSFFYLSGTYSSQFPNSLAGTGANTFNMTSDTLEFDQNVNSVTKNAVTCLLICYVPIDKIYN
jgi:hypothetical protein